MTVSSATAGALYYWDLTSSLTDLVSENTATVSGATQNSQGLTLSSNTDHAVFPNVFAANRRIEVDVASINRQGNAHGRFIIYNRGTASSPSLDAGFMFRMSQAYWAMYTSSWITTEYTDAAMFNNKTVIIELDANEVMTVKLDGETIVTSGSAINISSEDNALYIGSNDKSIHDAIITGIRVYEVA